jgi:acetyl esterase
VRLHTTPAHRKKETVSPAASTEPVTLDPNADAFVKSLEAQGGPPLYTLSTADARAVLSRVQSSVNVTKLPAEIEDRTILGGTTGEVSIRIIRPRGVSGALPVVMYFHGGGWVLGDKETHDRLVREIANGAQVAVVFVNYTRSPEAKYPGAIEQAYTATMWATDHGAEARLDPSRLSLAGDSVGGNMVAATTMLARQRGGPPIDLQLLFYPVTDATFETPSFRQFADGPWLTREGMKWYGTTICRMSCDVRSRRRRRCEPRSISYAGSRPRSSPRMRRMCCATRAKPTPTN